MSKKESDVLYIKAWEKICDYIKKEYDGVFPEGVRIDGPHDPYYWFALVVDAKGEACMFFGSHSNDTSPSEIYFRSDECRFMKHNVYECDYEDCSIMRAKSGVICHSVTACRVCDVVDHWSYFKSQLSIANDKWNSLRNFEA